ncbi:MAG: hypothetical protein QOI78_576 [Actinomycetota bacterium]|nr:hypothetical protein [Actinomycetota bacterium]
MRKIPAAAGLEVADAGNDYAPDRFLVTRVVARSVWQARRDAHSARREASRRAAWRTRSAEQCLGPNCDVHGETQ